MIKNNYYNYVKESNKPFFAYNSIIRVDSKDNILFKKIPKIKITNKPDKYKILLINSEKDLIEFHNKYKYQKNPKYEFSRYHIKWDKVSNNYSGIFIKPKLADKYFYKYYWIDYTWYTEYGYIWRFKIDLLSY